MQHVHRPQCSALYYRSDSICDDSSSTSLRALESALGHSILKEQFHATKNAQDLIKTLRKFHAKAKHIGEELGTSAVDHFIYKTTHALTKKPTVSPALQLDITPSVERDLLDILAEYGVAQACELDEEFTRISEKVRCLIDYLLEDASDDLSGIVFVQQRAVACMLRMLLNNHSSTRGKLRCVTSVGASNNSARRYKISELIDRVENQESLSLFRNGKANIVVATSVLEEGIDVQVCNTVACFALPDNLKSYIQRRGRARHKRSRYGMLVSKTGDQDKIRQFHDLEEELTAICQQERTRAEALSQLESLEEEMEYVLAVESTGYVDLP